MAWRQKAIEVELDALLWFTSAYEFAPAAHSVSNSSQDHGDAENATSSSSSISARERRKFFFINDELGSSFDEVSPADATFCSVPFYFEDARMAFTLMWPRVDVEEGVRCTREPTLPFEDFGSRLYWDRFYEVFVHVKLLYLHSFHH
jgi:hypothetical protein